ASDGAGTKGEDVQPDDLLDFWFAGALHLEEGGTLALDAPAFQRWFGKDDAQDEHLREKFGALVEAAARGELDALQQTPRGALALVLLKDQLPRNLWRGTPRAFAQDEAAQEIARRAIASGGDEDLRLIERAFLYMP